MGGAVKKVVKMATKNVKSLGKAVGVGGGAQAVASAVPSVAKKAVEAMPDKAIQAGGAIGAMSALKPKVGMAQESAVGGATSLLNKRNKGYREMQKKGTLG